MLRCKDGRSAVVDFESGDREQNPFPVQLLDRYSRFLQQFKTAHFEPSEVVSIVDHTSGVRVGIVRFQFH